MINIVSLSTIFIYTLLLLFNFNQLPEEVPIHYSIKGEIDGYGSKINLVWLLLINLGILIGSFFLVKNPHIANYPVKITEENKSVMYYRMQLFLSFFSVLISMMFSFFIFKSFDMVTEYIYFMIATVILPLAVISIFVRN